MSGSEMDGGTPPDVTTRTDEQLSRLFAEIRGEAVDEPVEFDQFGGAERDQRAEELLDAILDGLVDDATFRFDDALVKQSLDELLVLLIAMRSGRTNGQTLMADLEELFDTKLSPGSVYPTLHGLERDGTLEMFELVRSKEYQIGDREQAVAMTEAAARQHLALGTFLHAAAADL